MLRLVERLGGWLHLMAAPDSFVDDVLEIMAAESQHALDLEKRAEAERKLAEMRRQRGSGGGDLD